MKRIHVPALLVIITLSGCSIRNVSVDASSDNGRSDVAVSKSSDRQTHASTSKDRTAPHVHSRTCGCAWDRRERVWVRLADGHVHGRNCGHINVNGKWCLSR